MHPVSTDVYQFAGRRIPLPIGALDEQFDDPSGRCDDDQYDDDFHGDLPLFPQAMNRRRLGERVGVLKTLTPESVVEEKHLLSPHFNGNHTPAARQMISRA
jgi:hypothetical protein